MIRNKFTQLFVLLLAAIMLLTSCAASAAGRKNSRPTPVPEEEPRKAAQELADYIFEHGELPDNFITKRDAEALRWDSRMNYVSDVAPGKSIGGDRFGNYEERLPVVQGRKYFEADCYYKGGKRNGYRIIYSNDRHVWYSPDHYNTFIELFPTKTIQNSEFIIQN